LFAHQHGAIQLDVERGDAIADFTPGNSQDFSRFGLVSGRVL
jgi:hypothetical protein